MPESSKVLVVDPHGGNVEIRVTIMAEKGYTAIVLWTDVNHDHKIEQALDKRVILKSFADHQDQAIAVSPAVLIGNYLQYDWRTLKLYGGTGKWEVQIVATQDGKTCAGSPVISSGKYPDGQYYWDDWTAQWVEARQAGG